MKKQNSSLYKGSLTTIVMKLLQDNGRMYGYEITQKVKELSQGEISITEGALYPTLHKLEAQGLLTPEIEQVDNRVRKYYKITENGIKETEKQISEIQNFISSLQNIINPKHQPQLTPSTV
ncbi:putative DNA-binding protein ywzG [Capnocytophaga canimorsus]|uniref:Putative DNA-binding protein ywzG n=1 Tax=Capnocytophaga canimorsus TaxID=28188 RepID=A0A0B7GZT2_9FLAO|nr:PadR family transcriptional regulator [Capnocytophaga canimorsus]ATA76512.1 PadR family transcriptional regulator [Capnocytophaga canimorsus]MDT9499169.1 PadR family transcriptional regulator [Capnocytophaga canimorsus]PJI77272.1 PadR family transcriptional regulator [Capnocytophaga canimorsus]CEN32796.1 putative DNA-binding protein ywzG [Capnocytophaga canimorsus]STA71669.1 lineage-specific thermal regulator protein [Capnocytophaga canimorsus]